MPGNPVFEAFCAKIEELGGEEYVFDKLRAGESVSQVEQQGQLLREDGNTAEP
jgi:hypothetical protein